MFFFRFISGLIINSSLRKTAELTDTERLPRCLCSSGKPDYMGPDTLARAEYIRCEDHFYLPEKSQKAGNRSISDAEHLVSHS